MQKGFTLIELLITLAIVGVLFAIAYPSYQQHITKTHRTEGQIALHDVAARMAQYFVENNGSYAKATLEKLGVKNATLHQYYTLRFSKVLDHEYLIEAVPMGQQANHDKACGTLTLDQLGQQGHTGTGKILECWG